MSKKKKRTNSEQRGTPTEGRVPIAMELIIRRVSWAKRMAERRLSPPASVSSDVWAGVDKHPSLTREGKLTAHATPWAKQFRDDIESLK